MANIYSPCLNDLTEFMPRSRSVNMNNIHTTPFLFLNHHRKDYKALAEEAVAAKVGNEEGTQLSILYFSDENIKHLQKRLRDAVLKITCNKVIIPYQDKSDMIAGMQLIYQQDGRFLPNNIDKQVNELNDIFIKYTIPCIMTNVKQYFGYLRDINTPPVNLDRPLNVSNSGNKALPSTLII